MKLIRLLAIVISLIPKDKKQIIVLGKIIYFVVLAYFLISWIIDIL